MLRSLRHRLRQLWQQCELFENAGGNPKSRVGDGVHSASDRVHGVTVDRKVGVPHQPRSWSDVFSPTRSPQQSPKHQRPRRGRHGLPRISQTHPRDRVFVERLTDAFQRYNAELFGNSLKPVTIRVSRRMKNRLGHYMAATPSGLSAEIAISRQHIRRDPWDEVVHTLIHEMVHQWQDESGLPIDHGQHFRRKARAVGISARATRRVV